MPMQRVAEMSGNTYLYLKRWRKNAKQQMWRFDGTKKMMYNQHWTNYCLEIPAKGAQEMIKTVTGCTSRWW
jgi:hypothetical protein